MSNSSSEPEQTPGSSVSTLLLTYACADDVRRDRLRDLPRGLLARTSDPLAPGDAVQVRIAVEREKATVSASAVVRWVTPLAKGSIVGMDLKGAEHRDDVKLDLLLGIRGARDDDERLAVGSGSDLPALTVALLQPNRVLRQVIANALERFARDKEGGRLRIDAVGDGPSFVTAVAAHRPDLAVIDCDGVAGCADPLMHAVRLRESSQHVPVILLSGARSPRLDDRYTVTMQKPVAMKAFLDTADLLLAS